MELELEINEYEMLEENHNELLPISMHRFSIVCPADRRLMGHGTTKEEALAHVKELIRKYYPQNRILRSTEKMTIEV